MPNSIQDKSIVLGITGSIASYKAVDLASKLVQYGANVDVVMTPSATKFVTPLALSSITRRPVSHDIFTGGNGDMIRHITTAEIADLVVVTPATANIIAKLAHGLADDVVSLTVLSSRAPTIVCPAMDGHMYNNPATQENLKTLADRGIVIVGPSTGQLASGLTGPGRLIDPEDILGHIRVVLGRNGDLSGVKVVVSAAGTEESIDPVRFLGNHSSGKMGYAIAQAALDRGAETIIVAAPNTLRSPVGAKVVDVITAQEMNCEIMKEAEGADALIMAAAVADWRPAKISGDKIKKQDLQDWSIGLEKTDDILANIDSVRLVKVGFAAESENVLSNARKKLHSKNLDLIAANNITCKDTGFGTDINEVMLIDRDGDMEELGALTKYDVGNHILNRVAALLRNR